MWKSFKVHVMMALESNITTYSKKDKIGKLFHYLGMWCKYMPKLCTNYLTYHILKRNLVLTSNILQYFWFCTSDKDSNGEISWSEFVAFQLKSREVLKDTWPLNINDLRGEFADLDVNGDGKISKEEFVSVMTKYFQEG